MSFWWAIATSRIAGSEFSHARRTCSPSIWSVCRIELSHAFPVASATIPWNCRCSSAIRLGVVGNLELVDDRAHRVELRHGDTLGRESGSRWEQQATHLENLVEATGLHQLEGEAHPGEQVARLEAPDIRAVTATDIQHLDLGERPHGLAKRTSRQTELFGQLLLRR